MRDISASRESETGSAPNRKRVGEEADSPTLFFVHAQSRWPWPGGWRATAGQLAWRGDHCHGRADKSELRSGWFEDRQAGYTRDDASCRTGCRVSNSPSARAPWAPGALRADERRDDHDD